MIRFPSAFASLLYLLALSSCTSWHVVAPSPVQYIETQHPTRIRVTRANGTRVIAAHPVIRGDSLIGVAANPEYAIPDTAVSLPLTDVASIDVERVSAWKTILVIGVPILALVGIAYASMDTGPIL